MKDRAVPLIPVPWTFMSETSEGGASGIARLLQRQEYRFDRPFWRNDGHECPSYGEHSLSATSFGSDLISRVPRYSRLSR